MRLDQFCSNGNGSSPAASRPSAVVPSMESAAVEVAQLEAAFQSLEVEACQPLLVLKDEVSTKEAAPCTEKIRKEVCKADCDPEVEGKDQFAGGGPSKEMNEDDKSNKDAAESERKQKEHCLRVHVCCMARFAEAQTFKSRACVRKTLESFIPPGQNMIFLKTIPFQQGLACRFEVDATVTVFDSFVQVASGQQCRVQIRKEEDAAADSRVFWPQIVQSKCRALEFRVQLLFEKLRP